MTLQEAVRAAGRGGRSGPFDSWMVSETGDRLLFDLSDFVGRSQEIDEVAKLVEVSRVVTLTGPSGIGKTRLALEVARRLCGSYSGGI